MTTTVDLTTITLVYLDSHGTDFEQPLADITESGTLIDPETGDDLKLNHATIALRDQISKDLRNRFDDEHAHERSLARTQQIFDLFYDDKDEPDVAVRDALTDLMHMSTKRGIDFEQALVDANRMWTTEREEWELDG